MTVDWRLRRPNENALAFNAAQDEYVVGPQTASAGSFTLATSIVGETDEQVPDENVYLVGWKEKIALRVKAGSSASRFALVARNADDDAYRSFESDFDPLDGEPHHLVATVDRSAQTVVLYADGDEVHRESYTESLYDDPRKIVDGAWSSTYGHFHGQIARSSVYHRGLSAAEVEAWSNGSLPDDPTVRWEYDDGSGSTATDSSGNDNHGTVEGATWVPYDEYGLQFAESGDELTGANDPIVDAWNSSRQLTVSLDVRMDAINDPDVTWANVWELSDSSEGIVRFERHHDSDDNFQWTGARTSGNTSYPMGRFPELSAGETYTLTLVVDYPGDGESRAYRDGEFVYQASDPGDSVDWTSGDHRLFWHGWLDFTVDRVVAWNRPLSQDEIEAHADGSTPKDGLIAWLELDEGSGSVAADSSANDNDATVTGCDWIYRDTVQNPFAVDDSLLDVEVTDAFNRFARQATAVLDDPYGDKDDAYQRPTPVDLEVRWGDDETYRRRFGGFVVNPTSAQNRTELEILSHDFWLRKRQVFRSFSGVAIDDVLQDLIVDLTPLDWVDANVAVVQNETITRDWKGERLDEVVAELAAISADEEFGANDAGEFFFRPRETESASRDFGAPEHLDADFSADAKREVNRVTLYYGEGDNTGAVAVQDRASQKDLARELDRPRPVVIGITKSFPEIGEEEAAERKARQILNDRSVLQTGSLTTWEAFDVEPGEVTHVVAPEHDVDRDFRIAEITYRWRDDETKIQLAENTGGVVDTLVSLSNEVSRIDNRAADESATITQFLEFEQPLGIDLQLEAYKRTVPDDQLLFGSHKGGWGDTRTGGGLWGDQRGQREQLI